MIKKAFSRDRVDKGELNYQKLGLTGADPILKSPIIQYYS